MFNLLDEWLNELDGDLELDLGSNFILTEIDEDWIVTDEDKDDHKAE